MDQGGRCVCSCPEDLTFMLDRVQDLALRQNQAFFLLDLIFRSIFVYLRTTYSFLFKFSCFLHSSFVEASSCLSNVFFRPAGFARRSFHFPGPGLDSGSLLAHHWYASSHGAVRERVSS